jgi:hypothetical protein
MRAMVDSPWWLWPVMVVVVCLVALDALAALGAADAGRGVPTRSRPRRRGTVRGGLLATLRRPLPA